MNEGPEVVAAGDATLIVRFEERIAPAVNARAVALADAIRAAHLPGVRDITPSYRSVAVCFDPVVADQSQLELSLRRLHARAQGSEVLAQSVQSPVVVPVRYGGDQGPDLSEVARFAGLTETDVVEIHTAATYRVYMMGFIPGFAYMGVVDARIAAPRKATPRLRVAAGSVAIAGNQTGIYPSISPGGWQIIGRTDLKLFDASREPASFFKAGDVVRFIAADA